MQFDIDPNIRRQGRTPHELAMVNLLVFNLLFCMAIIAGTIAPQGSLLEHYKLWSIALPLCLSLGVIGYSFWQAKKTTAAGPWFVAAHWTVTTSRYKLLVLAYLVGGALVGLGWLISQSNPKLQELMFVALVRVAVAPMLISVMVLAVLESGALAQAGNGEVSEGSSNDFRLQTTPSPSVLTNRYPYKKNDLRHNAPLSED